MTFLWWKHDKETSRVPVQWKKKHDKVSSRFPFQGWKCDEEMSWVASSGGNVIKCSLGCPPSGENMVKFPLGFSRVFSWWWTGDKETSMMPFQNLIGCGQHIVKCPLFIVNVSQLAALWCPTAYSWCPFYFFLFCPWNILSLPLSGAMHDSCAN